MNQPAGLPLMAGLAGQYVLRPGQRISILGQRPVLQAGVLTRMLRGQTGAAISRLVGSLFSLCAHAHRRTAALAWNAACPQAPPAPVAPLEFLRLETARDHLRSMALDWSQRLVLEPLHAQRLLALAQSPAVRFDAERMTARQANQQLGELRAWLETHMLARHGHALEAFLGDCSELAADLRPAFHPLDVLQPEPQEQTIRLREIAQAMRASPGFVQHPEWRGRCVETGSWTRLRTCTEQTAAAPSALGRLAARWQELLLTAHVADLPEGALHDPLLSSGALALGEGAAIAWCEMARGLLLHWVQVDERGGVVDYRVLAPTEWNFHPQGSLAKAISALLPGDTRGARCLAAAFDACVDCSIESTIAHA